MEPARNLESSLESRLPLHPHSHRSHPPLAGPQAGFRFGFSDGVQVTASLTASGPAGEARPTPTPPPRVTAGNDQAATSSVGKHTFPLLCAQPHGPQAASGPQSSGWGERGGGRAVQLHRLTGFSPQKRGSRLHSSLVGRGAGRGGGGDAQRMGRTDGISMPPRAWQTISWPRSLTEKPGPLPLRILIFTGLGAGAPRNLYLSKPP